MKDDPLKQLVYYQVISLGLPMGSAFLMCFRQAGIGTYTSNVLKTPIIERVSQLRDKMFAHSLGEHIQGLFFPLHSTVLQCLTNILDGYKFLMQNCQLITLNPFAFLPFQIRSLRGPNLYFWLLSWCFYSSCPRRHASEDRASSFA